ncbi:EF-hand domain-containing protein [Altererythrobacter sp. CC-YST694]|uniref:EF-hand domain-containing protein n=1 Tax=Altererythrobacter sp. CC-YST694 TaxID=2755038 RepID=UPI001D006CED|nr:EF-hand domain-containing protein [Altererythrobacter sp. CC-YST694]MCB5425457.1 EF-hand domain-containing protein [Altererythrobacter sp. CC-YST694]
MKLILPTAITIAATLCLAPVQAQAQGQRDPGQLLERSDLDGDGQITRAEYTEARSRLFERLDRNKDGVINKDDAGKRRLLRRSGGEQLQELAAHMDTDGDGRVTRKEFVNGPTPMFDHADGNNNGVIDSRELATFRETLAARRTR